MTRVLIIDDERFACANLQSKIESLYDDLVIKTSTSALDALEIIRSWEPQIVFLDINMPILNGFELLEQIPKHLKKFSLIFSTAHDQYALEAFEKSAIDYLLKPVQVDRLKGALERARTFSEIAWQEKLKVRFPQKLDKIVGKSHRETTLVLSKKT